MENKNIKMDYENVMNKFKTFFNHEYKSYINELKSKIKKTESRIDYSEYTRKTAQKPKILVSEFLKSENINEHSVTNISKDFNLNFSFLLEFFVFEEQKKMDIELFDFIRNLNE